MEAVVEGRAAAGLLGPPFNHIALGRGCRVLARAHEEVPRLPGIGAVLRASASPATTEAARAYVRALAGAAAWATDDREEEAVRMLEAAGFDREGAVQLFGIRARRSPPPTTASPCSTRCAATWGCCLRARPRPKRSFTDGMRRRG